MHELMYPNWIRPAGQELEATPRQDYLRGLLRGIPARAPYLTRLHHRVAALLSNASPRIVTTDVLATTR